MSSKPLWLRAVHSVERAVGGPVESAVRTDTYFDIVTKATRVTGTVKRKVSSASPAGCTCSTSRPALTCSACASSCHGMERRLNRLTENVEELDERAAAAAERRAD